MAESPEEVAVLVQRVVKDIRNAFQRNPHIDEIGLIPCPEARYNRSPIVLVENKLGVESWCVKFLLPYVHNKLLLYRQRKQWLNKDGDGHCCIYLVVLKSLFPKFLFISVVSQTREEVLVCSLGLEKPSKASTWSGRVSEGVQTQRLRQRSLHTHLFLEEAVSSMVVSSLPEAEKRLSRVGREVFSYIVVSLSFVLVDNCLCFLFQVLLDELSSTKYWVSMHVSDHSGFHYRQFLLNSLIRRTVTDNNILVQNQMVNEQNPSLQKEEESAETEAACAQEQSVDLPWCLDEEMELCSELIDNYPGHETLWCHSDESLSNSHHSPATNHMAQAMDVDGLTESSSKQGYTQETKRLKRAPVQDSRGPEMEYQFVDKVLSTCRDVDQARFATAYRKWLVTFLGQ
ncbi:PTAR1 protein, partial [Acrocephalus arundinaceus]|nr:PTAR1 protein [Acrocephalus arundinaceus]